LFAWCQTAIPGSSGLQFSRISRCRDGGPCPVAGNAGKRRARWRGDVSRNPAVQRCVSRPFADSDRTFRLGPGVSRGLSCDRSYRAGAKGIRNTKRRAGRTFVTLSTSGPPQARPTSPRRRHTDCLADADALMATRWAREPIPPASLEKAWPEHAPMHEVSEWGRPQTTSHRERSILDTW